MVRRLKVAFLAAICGAILLSCMVSAQAWAPAGSLLPTPNFVAAVGGTKDIEAAIEAGAFAVSFAPVRQNGILTLAGDTPLGEALDSCGSTQVILKISEEDADEVYKIISAHGKIDTAALQIDASASRVIKWAQSCEMHPSLVGYYKGNVIFSAISFVKRFSDANNDGTASVWGVQLQTGNPYGVIFHKIFTVMFNKSDISVNPMFSTAETKVAAKRPDNEQGWNNAIEKGYEIIETAYPLDFADFKARNDSERQKLDESLSRASMVNYLADYSSYSLKRLEKAKETAQGLLTKTSSNTQLQNARVELDLAIKGLELTGDENQPGEFAVTPGRIAAAVLGIALVVAGQIYIFKKRKKA